MTFTTKSAEETIALGKKVGGFLKKGDILAMQGTLAAGKTTFTKGIAASLGITEPVTSPTFCLISEYSGVLPLYHLDVYRLNGADDFADLGADDLLYGDGISVIEWSEKIMNELPEKTITIKITAQSDNSRLIEIDNWKNGDIA